MKKPKTISPRKGRRLQALAWLNTRCTEGKKKRRIYYHVAKEIGVRIPDAEIEDLAYVVLQGLPKEVLALAEIAVPRPMRKGKPFIQSRDEAESPFLRLYFEILNRFHEDDHNKALAGMSDDLRACMQACAGVVKYYTEEPH